MSIRLSPWMRCEGCDKLHVRAYVTVASVCSCGRNLYLPAWGSRATEAKP